MKLLIVDDEKLIVAGLAHMVDSFEIPNLSVRTAFRGTQALEIMEKDFIDLVLVDVAMPGMNGLELIRNAQEKKLCSDFIIISGRQDFAFVQQALRSGVIDYLLKPIQRDELRSLLIRCAGKPENADAVSNKY